MPKNGKEEGRTLINRALKGARDVWQDIAGYLGRSPLPTELDDTGLEQIARRMKECLERTGGEVSARARAAELGQLYLTLDKEGRQRFLRLMASRFGPDKGKVEAAIAAYREASAKHGTALGATELRASLTPDWIDLLTQFNAIPEGVKFLVDMREDLLEIKKDTPELEAFDRDFRNLLAGWFDIGFLEMRRLDWNTAASLLEKLIQYESVHEIRSWDDLRNRLESDRRLYAFFHPRMPAEPLIFVEVALVNGISDSIQALLDESALRIEPGEADTAIFYSISNTQGGLRGIGFGNFLIKRVVADISADFPNLRHFATLSPIPGFSGWFDRQMAEGMQIPLSAEERRHLTSALGRNFTKADLRHAVADPRWADNAELAEALKAPLTRLAARYIVQAKRNGQPLDPVARFHLGNGAQVERINWLGDVSGKGMKQSVGMMVNYLYKPGEIERNHERFARSGHVAASSRIKALVSG